MRTWKLKDGSYSSEKPTTNYFINKYDKHGNEIFYGDNMIDENGRNFTVGKDWRKDLYLSKCIKRNERTL